jgi:hypothetical protein
VYDLLARLTAEPGVAIRRETLMTDVGDAHRFGSTTTLDVHVAALRRRLVADVARLPRIVTLRGHGYRLEPPARPADRPRWGIAVLPGGMLVAGRAGSGHGGGRMRSRIVGLTVIAAV